MRAQVDPIGRASCWYAYSSGTVGEHVATCWVAIRGFCKANSGGRHGDQPCDARTGTIFRGRRRCASTRCGRQWRSGRVRPVVHTFPISCVWFGRKDSDRPRPGAGGDPGGVSATLAAGGPIRPVSRVGYFLGTADHSCQGGRPNSQQPFQQCPGYPVRRRRARGRYGHGRRAGVATGGAAGAAFGVGSAVPRAT